MSTDINIKKRITILEESAILTKDVNSIDFVGAGVVASTIGEDVTVTINGGVGTIGYFLNQSVTQAPYKEFSSIVTTAVEQVVPLTVAGGVTSVIAEYQTPTGVPGTTQIAAGLWAFYLHFNAGSAGQNWIIRPTVLKRDLGGIETLLFTPDPVIVTSMNVTTEMYTSDGVFPSTTLLTTDRIVVRISMQNTTGVSQTVNFRTEGSQHYSVATTTLNPTYNPSAVLSVTGTAPVVSSGGTTPAISIPQADALTDGYLSSSDFAVFDAKVQSVTGLNTDNTDPENPIINISVDGTTITGSGTPIDPLVSVDAISGSGALNFVSKWTGPDSLGNSQIRDNGTTLAIGIAPQANISLKVLSIQEYGFASENTKTTSNTYGIAGSATGIGKARGVGVYGESSGGTLSNIGTEGQGVGGTVAIGGKFTSSTATTNYSLQLQDGTEGIGKVLTSMTADGKAQWVAPTVAAGILGISNSSGVYTYYATLTLAMAAATSGKTITFFTDITETSNVEIILKDGVDINFNGYTYTLNTSGTANCFLVNTNNGRTRFYNGKIQRLGGTISNSNSTVIYVNNAVGGTAYLDFSGVEIYSSFGVGISNNNYTTAKITGVKIRTFSHGCYAIYGLFISNSYIETTGGGNGCYATTITNCYVITTGGGHAIAFPSSGTASNCYASVSGAGSGNAIFCQSGVTVSNCTAISTRNSAVYNFAADAILTYAYSTANCGFEGGSVGGGNATNCYSYTTATQAYLYNGIVSNCYGVSTASYAICGINGGIVTNVYNSSMTTTTAIVMVNFKNAFGNTIISTYNNAAGHAVTPLAVSVLSNNTLMVTNASANCIYNAGAVSSKWANNTFVGSTTAVSANSTQLVTNTHDNQGNILM